MCEPQKNLWDWSLEHYALDGASDILIEGQDNFDLNVNIILWCCWCADRERLLSGLELRNAIEIAQTWSIEVTSRLRQARRALRRPRFQAYLDAQPLDEKSENTLYETIKGAELASEKLELSLYEAIGTELNKPAKTYENAHNNLSSQSGRQPSRTQHPSDAIKSIARRNIATYVSLVGVSKYEDFSISIIEKIVDRLLGAEQEN